MRHITGALARFVGLWAGARAQFGYPADNVKTMRTLVVLVVL
jgi:hypothetical protein